MAPQTTVTEKLEVEPTPRGFETSEGWLVALKALAGTAVVFLSLFGVGIPRWLRPDAPWLGMVAFVASTASVAVYTRSRSSLKAKALELAQTAPGTYGPGVAGFVEAAQRQVGVPYSWGGGAGDEPDVPTDDNPPDETPATDAGDVESRGHA